MPDWWQRNWKWLVPTLVVVCVAVIGLFITGLLYSIKTFMESTEPYKFGMQRALSNPVVISRLGEPITAGWLPTGNIEVSQQTGEAALAITLHGSRADGTLYIQADKRAGRWYYELLEVAIDNDAERISLLAEPG